MQTTSDHNTGTVYSIYDAQWSQLFLVKSSGSDGRATIWQFEWPEFNWVQLSLTAEEHIAIFHYGDLVFFVGPFRWIWYTFHLNSQFFPEPTAWGNLPHLCNSKAQVYIKPFKSMSCKDQTAELTLTSAIGSRIQLATSCCLLKSRGKAASHETVQNECHVSLCWDVAAIARKNPWRPCFDGQESRLTPVQTVSFNKGLVISCNILQKSSESEFRIDYSDHDPDVLPALLRCGPPPLFLQSRWCGPGWLR